MLKSYPKLSIQKFLFVFSYQSECFWNMKAIVTMYWCLFSLKYSILRTKPLINLDAKKWFLLKMITAEWFTRFKRTRLMIKWYSSSASCFLRTDIHNYLQFFSSGSVKPEHVVKIMLKMWRHCQQHNPFTYQHLEQRCSIELSETTAMVCVCSVERGHWVLKICLVWLSKWILNF